MSGVGRAAVLLALVAGPGPGLAAQTMAAADSLLAAGDTSGAIAVYEAIVRRDLKSAEAHYRAGLLYMTRHVPGTDLSPNRRKAEEHFRYATRFAPDSGRYALALADLFRSEDWAFTRMQVRGLVKRARERAERAGDDWLLAEAAYRQARADWDKWSFFGHRYVSREAGVPAIYPDGGDPWREVLRFFHERLVAVPGAGAEMLGEVERNLWTALSTRPLYREAAGLLVLVMGETDRWEEAAAVTRRLVRTAPDSGWAWALHGLALARTRRWRDAEAAFDSAFARMGAEEQTPFHDLGQIMRDADRVRYAHMRDEERDDLEPLYWRVAQPLTLTDANEVRTEFHARIVYAQHRWTDPWRGYQGIASDPGVVYVAYGPPDIATESAWVYERPRFYFNWAVTPGFWRARFGGDARERFRLARLQSPARFDNVPVMRTLDTVLVQTARFRGPGDSAAVLVVGAVPLRRMADAVAVADLPLTTGAVITDDRGVELQRDAREETVTGVDARELQYRTWRLRVRPGGYLLRVEAHLPSLERAARAVQYLPVTAVPRHGLALSDLLVAQRVAPRDSDATRWDQYYIEPNAGRFAPGEPLGLLWEIYNLTPNALGATRYEVQLWITVEAVERKNLVAAIVGGIADAVGLTSVYGDQVSIRYVRDAWATRERARAEHLMVDLRNAPAGRYGLEIIVNDLIGGTGVRAARTFTIGTEPVRR